MASEFHDFIKLVHNASTQGKLGEVIFKFVKAEMQELKNEIEKIKTSIEVLDRRDEWLADKMEELESIGRIASEEVAEAIVDKKIVEVSTEAGQTKSQEGKYPKRHKIKSPTVSEE